jgi:hypothetical protein
MRPRGHKRLPLPVNPGIALRSYNAELTAPLDFPA